MPHGRLTPLGKQLRCVLAGLRSRRYTTAPKTRRAPAAPASTKAPLRPRAHHEGSGESLAIRRLHESSVVAGGAQAAVVKVDEEDTGHRIAEAAHEGVNRDEAFRLPSNWEKNATNAIKVALGKAGKASVAPIKHLRFVGDTWISSDTSKRLGLDNLQTILAIVARQIHSDAARAEDSKMTAVELTHTEAAVLQLHHTDPDDIRNFAAIIVEKDSLEAAKLIEERLRTHGPQNFPASVLITVLRRQYIAASALIILINQCILLSKSAQPHSSPFADPGIWFIIFGYLLDHCRAVRPMSLPDVCDLWLQNAEQSEQLESESAADEIRRMTMRLNMALHLIAKRTSLEPYKDIPLQEASFVKVLTFMAQHDPPIQTTQRGYNAITSVQLAQKKTLKEQAWAEIKAPSWPPWRQLRNAMDENVITVEDHGTSVASRTIQSMHMAGYSPNAWDEVAAIYAGWDTDGTPTIQTRQHGDRFPAANDAVWTARIKTTRTIQEAWACYLAYEEQSQVPSQHVLLAIVEKLQYEARRLYQPPKRNHQDEDLPKIYPGDVLETHPPPESIHQHTYTRTPAPTMDEFYDSIRARGIVPEGHFLAFLIENIIIRSRGIRYLIDSLKHNQSHVALWKWDPRVDLSQIDNVVFHAAIKFHSRLTKEWITLPAMEDTSYWEMDGMWVETRDRIRRSLNPRYPLTYALFLLMRRKSQNLTPWRHILTALGQLSIFTVHRAFADESYHTLDNLPSGLKWCHGTTLAYELACMVSSRMGKLHYEHDSETLHALCICTENAVVGSWKLLRDHSPASETVTPLSEPDIANQLAKSADALLANFDISQKLRGLFQVFVGADQSLPTSLCGYLPLLPPVSQQQANPEQNSSASPAPVLLVPGPYLLHAYIRALGWAADYQGLLDLVRWMLVHADALTEQRLRDRNGRAAMRRAIVALRVFTERLWYRPSNPEEGPDADADAGMKSKDASAQLAILETPASKEVVDEIRGLVALRGDWEGWPQDEEVEVYCSDPRFRWFLNDSADAPLPKGPSVKDWL